MVDVSLTSGGITFTFQDGDVKSCKSNINMEIEKNALPLSGPMSTFLFDFNGVEKTITISGVLTDATTTRTSTGTITTIAEQKRWLEGLANGNQNLTTFVSNYESQSVTSSGGVSPYLSGFTITTIMVERMDFEEVAGEPNTMPFSMSFVVGGV